MPTTTKRRPSKAARKPAKARARRAPQTFRVFTGRGPSPAELGAQLVAAFNQGKGDAWAERAWAPSIESVEGQGVGMGWRGLQAVRAKNAQWVGTHILHGGSAEGPYVGSTGFAVRFRIDVEDKATGRRQVMEEVGVYTVRNGRIVREEFMYSCR